MVGQVSSHRLPDGSHSGCEDKKSPGYFLLGSKEQEVCEPLLRVRRTLPSLMLPVANLFLLSGGLHRIRILSPVTIPTALLVVCSTMAIGSKASYINHNCVLLTDAPTPAIINGYPRPMRRFPKQYATASETDYNALIDIYVIKTTLNESCAYGAFGCTAVPEINPISVFRRQTPPQTRSLG